MLASYEAPTLAKLHGLPMKPFISPEPEPEIVAALAAATEALRGTQPAREATDLAVLRAYQANMGFLLSLMQKSKKNANGESKEDIVQMMNSWVGRKQL